MSDVTFRPRARQYQAPTEKPGSTRCTAFLVPDDPTIRAAVLDALAYLALPDVWIPSENVSEIDMQALMSEMLFSEGDGC